MVLILPYKLEITDPNKIVADIQALSNHALTIDLDKPQREQKAVLEEVRIPYIDLKPVFAAQVTPQSLYLDENTHLGPKGHQLLAQVIADYLN